MALRACFRAAWRANPGLPSMPTQGVKCLGVPPSTWLLSECTPALFLPRLGNLWCDYRREARFGALGRRAVLDGSGLPGWGIVGHRADHSPHLSRAGYSGAAPPQSAPRCLKGKSERWREPVCGRIPERGSWMGLAPGSVPRDKWRPRTSSLTTIGHCCWRPGLQAERPAPATA